MKILPVLALALALARPASLVSAFLARDIEEGTDYYETGLVGSPQEAELLAADLRAFGPWYRDFVLGNATVDLVVPARDDGDEDGGISGTRRDYFDIWAARDDSKVKQIWSQVDGRPTFTTFHFLVLPVWFSDEDPNNPKNQMDIPRIKIILERNREYYRQMSQGTVDLSWTVLDQYQFKDVPGRSKMDVSKDAMRAYATSIGYEFGDGSYDGMVLIYNIQRRGEHNFSGGVANVNGDDPFMWLSYALYDVDFGECIDYQVTRHEFGHNVGHGHHRAMAYERLGTQLYDGFDMMSGGNGYDVSDLHVASKWFFGWVPHSSVVHLQPEGATDWCPECVSSGTFEIVTFDDHTRPVKEGDVAGIHIPVHGERGVQVYSYWLQYRTGNQGHAAGGLSVHLVWLTLGKTFGGSHSQLNYDVHGDTETTEDSFVLPGTCYVIEPALVIAKRGLEGEKSSEQVIPRVCVDSLKRGESIAVSVSFLERSYLEPVDGTYDSVKCTESGTASHATFRESSRLFRLEGVGVEGAVGASICPTDVTASIPYGYTANAYFYDRYPRAVLNGDAPPAHGAFAGKTFHFADCCAPGTTLAVNNGATAVKISNLNPDKPKQIYLNEIEIYDGSGTNVALAGRCYSKYSDDSGNPDCLNDGIKGTYPEACSSFSAGWDTTDSEHFDVCVLEKETDIKRIVVYPFNDPDRPHLIDRLDNLQIEVFSYVELGSRSYRFKGPLKFVGRLADPIKFGFSSTNAGPSSHDITLRKTYPCPRTGADPAPAPFSSLSSILGDTWVLVDAATPDGFAAVESKAVLECTTAECGVNHFPDGGTCARCPPDSYAKARSSSCTPCPDFHYLAHPRGDKCTLGNESDPSIRSGVAWRIWLPNYGSTNTRYLDVDELDFYASEDCSGDEIDPSGTPVHSKSTNRSGPEYAFNKNGKWIGQPLDGAFWLGMEFPATTSVSCVKITQGTSYATLIYVQARTGADSPWTTVTIATDVLRTATIRWSGDSGPTKTPAAAPTLSPMALTDSPTAAPNAGGGYTYVGCFKDDKNDKALPVGKGRNKSTEKCAELCVDYAYFGLQGEGICSCGNSGYDKHGPGTGCDCDAANVGKRLNCVYQYGPATGVPTTVAPAAATPVPSSGPTYFPTDSPTGTPSWSPSTASPTPENKFEYLGCYNDDRRNRALSVEMGSVGSIRECADRCREYRYFSVQGPMKCWCGDEGYNKHGYADKLCDCESKEFIGSWVACCYQSAGYTDPPTQELVLSSVPSDVPSEAPTTSTSVCGSKTRKKVFSFYLMDVGAGPCPMDQVVTNSSLCERAAKTFAVKKIKVQSKKNMHYGCVIDGKKGYFNKKTDVKPESETEQPLCAVPSLQMICTNEASYNSLEADNEQLKEKVKDLEGRIKDLEDAVRQLIA